MSIEYVTGHLYCLEFCLKDISFGREADIIANEYLFVSHVAYPGSYPIFIFAAIRVHSVPPIVIEASRIGSNSEGSFLQDHIHCLPAPDEQDRVRVLLRREVLRGRAAEGLQGRGGVGQELLRDVRGHLSRRGPGNVVKMLYEYAAFFSDATNNHY